MNTVVIRSQAELLDALRAVLDTSTVHIAIREAAASSLRPDLTVRADCEGRVATFVAQCRLNPTVAALDQFVASVGVKRNPLLMTVRLSESFVAQCRQRGVSCLDLNGRMWIKGPGLLIDRNTAASPIRYRLTEPEIRFFSPKSSRVARALLHDPGRTWRQSDLAHATGLSQGLLSRLLNHAARQGWAEGKRGDWRLTDPGALLDAWEKADDWSKRVTLRQYSILEPDCRVVARRLFERANGELVFTQWFAAGLRHPYADVPVVTAYRRSFPTEEEQRSLDYHAVVDGGKVWIAVPRDDGVFKSIRQVQGLPLVSDAQMYLDLIHVGLRGPDQAKALREWPGFCRK